MSYGELNIGPIRAERDAKTGRFLKGHTPVNKGKKWNQFMSKRAQRRASKGWKNLELHRHRPENAGRPKKEVVAVMDDGRWTVFPYSVPAAEWCQGSRHNVVRCCRENGCHQANTDHRYMGVRFYFENDSNWLNKIREHGKERLQDCSV